jgi:hypothetical protein
MKMSFVFIFVSTKTKLKKEKIMPKKCKTVFSQYVDGLEKYYFYINGYLHVKETHFFITIYLGVHGLDKIKQNRKLKK